MNPPNPPKFSLSKILRYTVIYIYVYIYTANGSFLDKIFTIVLSYIPSCCIQLSTNGQVSIVYLCVTESAKYCNLENVRLTLFHYEKNVFMDCHTHKNNLIAKIYSVWTFCFNLCTITPRIDYQMEGAKRDYNNYY